MKKKLTTLITLVIVLLSCVAIFAFDLVACSVDEDGDEYSLQLNGKSNVLVYQSAFDFDEYFRDSYILRTTESGEEFFIPLTQDMFAGHVDTSSVGDKKIDIKYDSKTISFEYSVKYKVEFLVDGQVFDTQLVFDIDELDTSKIPNKEGFTFIEWQDVPQMVSGNAQITANFSQNVVVPQLFSLNAEYGDTLQDLTLPSNEFGSWQFLDGLSTSIGDVGNQTKAVQFVLKSGEPFGDSTTVSVAVSKKTLQFKFDSLEFIYDGAEKQPTFYFEGVDKTQVNTVYVPYQGEAVNVGEYEFEYIIDDENYQGEYSGKFDIVKKQVSVKVNDCQMIYLQSVPSGSFAVTDLAGAPLSQALIDELGIELDIPLLSPVVGEYQIGLKEKVYDNFEVSVQKGTLTVNKATHNVIALPNAEQVIYGNTLNQVELSSSIVGVGSWAWIDDSIVISAMEGVSAIARFTPNDQDNYEIIEQEVSLSVLKRTVEISITQSEFIYNGASQSLIYSVNGILPGDETAYTVLGNTPQINANSYAITLRLDSNKYQAQEVNAQLIIAKANSADFESVQSAIGIITYNKNVASKLMHVNLPSGYIWKDNSLELLIGTNEYEVAYIPEDRINYNDQSGYITLSVQKAQSVIEIGQTEFTYNKNYDYNLNATLNHAEAQLDYQISLDGEIVESITNVGNYQVNVICDESEHYKGTSLTISVQVFVVENNDVLQKFNATYLDTLSQFALPTNPTGVWAWVEGDDAKVGNAGTQVHKAVFTPNDTLNYNAREVDVEFNVSKKIVVEPTLSVNSYIYTGSTIKPNVNGTTEYCVKENLGGVNAGTYNIVLELTDSDNFVWSSSENSTITLNYTISQAQNSWIRMPSLTKTTWAYGDTAGNAVCQAQFGEEAISYIGIDNDYNSDQMPTNAGLYKAVFTVVGTDSYAELTYSPIEFTITKQIVEVPQVKESAVYTGQEIVFATAGEHYTISGEKGTNVGNYKVVLTLEDSNNYKWSNSENAIIEFSASITKAENSWEKEPTLSKKTWIYGEEQATIGEYASKLGDDVSISYIGIDNDYNSDQMPTNAGSYKVVFTVLGTDNYTELTCEIDFTITKQIVEVPQVTTSAVYTGQEIVFVTTGENYTISGEKGTNVGNYKVVLTLEDSNNYKWSNSENASIEFSASITKAENSWTKEPTLSKKTWIYGEESAIINEYESRFGEEAISYIGIDNDYNSDQMPTNAGLYKVVFTVAGIDNYTELTCDIDFTITKKQVTPPVIQSKEYNGQTLVADVQDTTIYTVIANEGGDSVGEYKVILQLVDFDNYSWTTCQEDVIVLSFYIYAADENTWITTPVLSKTTWAYGEESAIINEYESRFGEEAISYIGIDNDYNSDQMPTNAGSYKVVFTVVGTDNYAELTCEIDFTITKKIVEVPQVNESAVYTGQEIVFVTTGENYTISGEKGTNVGNYKVVLTLEDSNNYKWSNSENASIEFSASITKAENSWTKEPTLSKKTWIYGEESAIINEYESRFGEEAISYIGIDNDYNSDQMPTNAGSYKVVFTVAGTDNYAELTCEIDFTITKQIVEVPQVKESAVYTGQEIVFVATGENYTISGEKGTNVGNYKVVLTLEDSNNYKWSNSENASIEFSASITKAENSWEKEPTLSKKTWIYGEEQATIGEYASKFGDDVSISYVGIDNDYNSDQMPTNAGSYKVVFTVAGTDNYAELTCEIDFTITKQIVEVPQVTTSAVYTGQEIVFVATGEHYTISGEKGTNVGNYKVVLTLKDSNKFKWSNDDSASIEFNVAITKAENSWEKEPTLSKKTWIYGEEQATIGEYASKFGDDVSISYVGIDNDYNSDQMPTNAGSYKVVFIVEATDNYTGLTQNVSFVIDKISVAVPQSPASKSYTGQLLTADVAQNDLYTIENNGGINAGDYEVKLTLNDSTIYKWADGTEGAIKTLTFTITKIANQWLGEVNEIEDSKIIIYGETINIQAKDGNVKISAQGIEGTNYSSQTMPQNVGVYQITLIVDESTNYTGLTKTFKLTIVKYQLRLEAPIYKDTVFYENKVDVADVNNMQSQATLNLQTAGTFTYTMAQGQVITDGKVQVVVSFVPDDMINFEAPLDVYATIKVKEVAHIGTNSNYYGSIESALKVAKSGDVVWVKAGEMNAVIAKDCTIPAGVTLNIPHEADKMNADGVATLTGGSAVAIKVLTTITINPSVTLTNNGTLQIAGQLSGGTGGHPYAGHTTGNAAKLVLRDGATINSVGGTINLFGLIVEEDDGNGSQVIVDGGSLSLPFVVRDYRGGTYMSKIYTKATAFNQFELRNITAKVTIKNSANVYGYANIYSGDQHNATKIALISTTSNAVIHLASSRAYLTSKYNIVGGYNGNDNWADGIMDIKIYGGATADPMSLEVKYIFTVTVSTKDVFFPITWRLNVSLFNGEYTMPNQYKLMPGAVFVIGEGAIVKINSLAVYTQAAMDIVETPSDVLSTKYENKNADVVDAKCIVKSGGKLTIGYNGGSVGGDITIEDGGEFECVVTTKTHYTCNSCGQIYESKPIMCSNGWHFSFTSHQTDNKSVISKEGTKDRNGTTCDIVLTLTVNGEAY